MKRSASARALIQQQMETYEQHLPLAHEYLAARGIPPNVARGFRLGVVAEPTPGLGDEDVVGRLAIPYLTPSGPVDIRFRAMNDSGGPKYLSRPGAHVHLYNVEALSRITRGILVCEGEVDTVSAAAAGLPAVGVPGAANWKKHFPLLLDGFERVYVMCDGDEAGREFGRRVTGSLENAVTVSMPDGMDVNDVLLSEGAAGIRRRVGVGE